MMFARITLVVVLLAGGGCAGTEEKLEMDLKVGEEAQADHSARLELKGGEEVEAIAPPEELVPEDVPYRRADAEVLSECQPGEGCFLDKCQGNGDCQSGWCVEHMGEAVCSKVCQDECPNGWACRQVSGTVPDIVYICVSNVSNLCKPCSASGDCNAVGGADDVCVAYGAQGSFCGGVCETTEECPWGFTCKEAETVEGVLLKQCVADAGVCPCTGKSAKLGLLTPCEVANEAGKCKGKRVCTPEGLSECDAATPSSEECNGLDDDCNGQTDDPNLVEGEFKNLCDDGNACTQDSCQAAGGCTQTILSEGECIDGDACTVGDHCEAGACKGLPILCDDKDPCTDDYCDGLGGCKGEFNHAACDDSDPCTVGDICTQGLCAGFALACDCEDDADCDAFEDGDACNGTLSCDKAEVPYKCKVVPASVVECPQPEGSGAICQAAACDPQNGQCKLLPAHDGFACDDGDPCTLGDVCAGGTCKAGVAVSCTDSNVCTADSCKPGLGCVHEPKEGACDDANACTTGDQCQEGACVGLAEVPCDDGNACTTDSCHFKLGCMHLAFQGACDDGNACTVGDMCSGGSCVPGGYLDCNDGNPCTKDACDPATGCTITAISGPCNDGDPCTVNDQCKLGKCAPGPAQNCNDGNPCTNDSCNESGLCIHAANADKCDDGNPCTTGEQCAGGTCKFAQILSCDDENPCTADSCDPVLSCIHVMSNAACDDGNLCTTGDHCSVGKCVAGGQMTCKDSNPCTDDSCDPKNGCVFTPNQAACDDGNVCTENDKCSAGVCAPGTPKSCDDKNQCTMDFCGQPAGCSHLNISGPCDDADACTANTVCKDGVCGNGIPFVCEDANPCTDNECDKLLGCHFEPNQAGCDDKNACTAGDKCGASQCQPGALITCNDNEVCTTDSCAPASGCVFTPVADLTVCGVKKHCDKGLCVDDCSLVHGSVTLTYSGSIQSWTVPDCVTSVTIEAWGAEGGKNNPCTQKGGKGARMKGAFTVVPKETLKIVVAGRGLDRGTNDANESGTGGGGSFVWKDSGTQLLIAAGGGGGGAICQSGGCPATATGKDAVTDNSGTSDSTNAYPGGANGSDGQGQCPGKGWNNVKSNPAGYGGGSEQGGYGGGGTVGASHGGGGGGGYSGGAGKAYTGPCAAAGGGGGSYNSGANQSNSAGVQTGHGKVEIVW
jgi:hypothetical protein